jgi:protein-disulfide isomerase
MRRITFLLAALVVSTVGSSAFAQTSTPAPAQNTSEGEAQFLRNSEAFVRKLFAWGPDFQINLGPTSPSPSPDFYLIPVHITYNGVSDSGVLYISKDGKTVLRGELFDTSADPYAANRAKLHTEGNPSKGPAGAKVTLVEFSDFQCPHCRALYLAMKTLAPKYPQIRVVFKDLPIAALHPWAETAAVGGRCAYRQLPDAFWVVHDALFENQEYISTANIWEKLIDFAGQAGLDKEAFKTCLASPEAQKDVGVNMDDAGILGITSTPTVFVNGRPVVGGDPATLEQYINYELGGQTAAQSPKTAQGSGQKPAQKAATKP